MCWTVSALWEMNCCALKNTRTKCIVEKIGSDFIRRIQQLELHILLKLTSGIDSTKRSYQGYNMV